MKEKRSRIRKEPPLDPLTNLAEIQVGMEEPHVVAAPENRRQKATECNTHVNVLTTTEGSAKGGKARRIIRHRQQKDKENGLINCSTEGCNAEKQSQKDILRKNSEEQHTQVILTHGDA
jgi:hypothetical protein